MNDLKLIVFDNILKLGDRVNANLGEITGNVGKNYKLTSVRDRFSNGEGKMKIIDTVRGKEVFILSDVGNYSLTYNMYGFTHHMGPDEHFQDIKRAISALSGYASRVTLVTPLLYQSRQHKRKGRESLDCAVSLQELERMGVDHIVTFDAHDPSVCNAIPNLPFENIYPTHIIFEDLIKEIDPKNVLVISPDMGAMERARYYAEILGCDVGVFYKRRDLSTVVDGKNPIVEHAYMGAPVKDKTVIVVDDMIASGNSILDVGKKLREDGAQKIVFISTFALFTSGISGFEEAYDNNYFDKIYTTNLTYIPEEIKEKEWLHVVDCSKSIAEIILALHTGESLKNLSSVNNKDKVLRLVDERRKQI